MSLLLLPFVAAFPCLRRSSLGRFRRLTTLNIAEDHVVNLNLGKERVLYADNDVVVMDKPANTQSVAGLVSRDSLAGRVTECFGLEREDMCVAHRLDYATSGAIIFARNRIALTRLHAQFRRDDVIEKVYFAVVDGVPEDNSGEINAPLGKNPARGTPYICVDHGETGKPSRTLWKKIETRIDLSLLELRPLTGRTHQLRVHMSSIGFPILGDSLYGNNSVRCQNARRLHLHAHKIAFLHPRTGARIVVSSPLPFSLQDFDELNMK